MRLRTLSAVGAMVLIAASLTSCRTNVGVAARIDGQKVTESQVGDYLTAKARANPTSQGVQTAIPARSFVVEVLIDVPLYTKLYEVSAHRTPSAGDLSRAEATVLQGGNLHSVVTKAGFTGFTSAFESKLLQVQGLLQLLGQEAAKGIDVNSQLKHLSRSGFPVSVNPRYGVWDSTTASLSSGASAGVPSFLTLRSGSTSGS